MTGSIVIPLGKTAGHLKQRYPNPSSTVAWSPQEGVAAHFLFAAVVLVTMTSVLYTFVLKSLHDASDFEVELDHLYEWDGSILGLVHWESGSESGMWSLKERKIKKGFFSFLG